MAGEYGRSTQVVVEVLRAGDSYARSTQIIVEVLRENIAGGGGGAPSDDALMRHGKYFDGDEQPFWWAR